MNQSIQEKILEKAKLRKPKIGIVITHTNKRILAGLKRGSKYTDLLIIGTKIKGFQYIKTDDPMTEIVKLLKEKKIEGLVQGHADALRIHEIYYKEFGYDKTKVAMPALAEDAHDRAFFLGPYSCPEGWTKEEKIKFVEMVIPWIKEFDIEPKLGFLSGRRHGSEGKNSYLDQTYNDAEEMVKYFRDRGYQAEHYTIELEKAIEGANFIIPQNGLIGNQIFRAIVYLGNGKYLGAPILGVKEVFEVGSRNEEDYSNHIIHAAARINSQKV